MTCDNSTFTRERAEGTLRPGSDGRWHVLEECDDGNFLSGDGCSEDCLIEDGFYCTPHLNTRRDSLRVEKGDYCRTIPVRGLFEQLLMHQYLEGWAEISHLEGRGPSVLSDFGWMKWTLAGTKPSSQGSNRGGMRVGSIFRRSDRKLPSTGQHELFSCGCNSDFTILTEDAGRYEALQGLVSHDAYTCKFRIYPAALSVLLQLELDLLDHEKVEVYDPHWIRSCSPCTFDSENRGLSNLTLSPPVTIEIKADKTSTVRGISLEQLLFWRANISYYSSQSRLPRTVNFASRQTSSVGDDPLIAQIDDAVGIPAGEAESGDQEILRVAVGSQGYGEPACDFSPFRSVRSSNYFEMRRFSIDPASAWLPSRDRWEDRLQYWNLDGVWEGETRAEVEKAGGGLENGRCAVKVVIDGWWIRMLVYGCRQGRRQRERERNRQTQNTCPEMRSCSTPV